MIATSAEEKSVDTSERVNVTVVDPLNGMLAVLELRRIVGATPSTRAVESEGGEKVRTGVPAESVIVAVPSVMTAAGMEMPSVSSSPAATWYWNLMAVVPVPLT